MKDEISTILGYLECEREMFLLRNQFLSLSSLQPVELQETVAGLLDAINRTNIQSHKYAGFYYLLLGCAYFEQDEYQRTVFTLQSAINEMWGTNVNKALARWLLGLCYSNMQDFSRARNELLEALQLLATHRGINSSCTENKYRSRQAIRQNIKEAYGRLFDQPLFRTVRPEPSQNAERFPVQNPPVNESDVVPISVTNENSPIINVPVTTFNENYPVNKLSFNSPSSIATPEKEHETVERDYENRTDDDGYLVIHSVPIYEQYVRAGKSGGPEPVVSKNKFAEFHQVNIEGILYTVHPLRSKAKNINLFQEGSWGWIKVKGKSMNQLKGNTPIDDGDYALFQINPSANDNDIVIVANKENRSTHVKRFRKTEKMLYSETAENGGEYEVLDMKENDMEIIGIVYAVAKPIIS